MLEKDQSLSVTFPGSKKPERFYLRKGDWYLDPKGEKKASAGIAAMLDAIHAQMGDTEKKDEGEALVATEVTETKAEEKKVEEKEKEEDKKPLPNIFIEGTETLRETQQTVKPDSEDAGKPDQNIPKQGRKSSGLVAALQKSGGIRGLVRDTLLDKMKKTDAAPAATETATQSRVSAGPSSGFSASMAKSLDSIDKSVKSILSLLSKKEERESKQSEIKQESDAERAMSEEEAKAADAVRENAGPEGQGTGQPGDTKPTPSGGIRGRVADWALGAGAALGKKIVGGVKSGASAIGRGVKKLFGFGAAEEGIAVEQLLDKNGKPLQGAARQSRIAKLTQEAEAASVAQKETSLLGRVMGGIKGAASKVTGLLGGATEATGAVKATEAVTKSAGVLSKIPGAGLLGGAGKALGFAGRIAGKAALPLALGMSAYDAYKGFTADEKATTSQKFLNAGRNVASGLTFGLIDSTQDKMASGEYAGTQVAKTAPQVATPAKPPVTKQSVGLVEATNAANDKKAESTKAAGPTVVSDNKQIINNYNGGGGGGSGAPTTAGPRNSLDLFYYA
jgi:hypothetical protein